MHCVSECFWNLPGLTFSRIYVNTNVAIFSTCALPQPICQPPSCPGRGGGGEGDQGRVIFLVQTALTSCNAQKYSGIQKWH